MQQETLRKIKWFWAWQDEQEEKWLRQMSLQGWHLGEPNFPCVYTFEKGAPQDFAYRLDYITSSIRKDEYFQIFRDAGWEHLGQMVGWQYFRKSSKDGFAPEIYTDAESKSQKYRRLLVFMLIFLPIMIINVNSVAKHSDNLPGIILKAVNFGVFFIYTYALIRIALRVIALRKQL